MSELDSIHKPCRLWTIKVEIGGMSFTISDIAFEDIAQSAAKGIRADNPKAEVRVYFAKLKPEDGV